MEYLSFDNSNRLEVRRLFSQTFSDSEGESEGALIETLVSNLMDECDSEATFGFFASDSGALVGGIFFTRLKFDSPVKAFLLSPVAIRTDQQGKGIGQALIRFGIDQLRREEVKLVFTYGDPGFYSKVGFEPVSPELLNAPFELSQPEGWLLQSLDGSNIEALPGVPRCVNAFDNPEYW